MGYFPPKVDIAGYGGSRGRKQGIGADGKFI